MGTKKDAFGPDKLVVGKQYEVRCSRKGTYLGKCLSVTGECASFEIVSGVAHFISEDDRGPGNKVDARASLCRVFLRA